MNKEKLAALLAEWFVDENNDVWQRSNYADCKDLTCAVLDGNWNLFDLAEKIIKDFA